MDSGERPPTDDADETTTLPKTGDGGGKPDDDRTDADRRTEPIHANGSNDPDREAEDARGETAPETGSGATDSGPTGSDAATGSGATSTEPTRPDAPRRRRSANGSSNGIVYRFFNDQTGPLMWIREVVSSALVVLALGLLLFALSGVWPPMVAVESGSMEPNMVKGDLIFVTEPGRFAPDAETGETGVVTHQEGQAADYRTFGSYGSVVVFAEPGRVGSPIIHRTMFHVEAGENWIDRADTAYLGEDSCEAVTHCPAPHDGFITKGDNNPRYDQTSGIAPPVKSGWVTGVARLRIPYLGWVRLLATGQASVFGVDPGATLVAAGVSALVVGRRYRHLE